MERTSDYWFMIEPYVHINIANGYMLLYNTLDKETIISNNEKSNYKQKNLLWQ